MNLELKNVKFSELASEETNFFTANIYHNGKKVGEAKNDGQGGSTHVYSLPNTREAFKQAEQYALGLPSFEFEYPSQDNDSGKMVITSNLETQVDDLFMKWLELEQCKKHFNKGLVYKNLKDDNIEVVGWGSANTISKMLKTQGGINAIQKAYTRLKGEGYEILNTNLKGLIK